MISRRGFLGSVLGMVGSATFLALTDAFPFQRTVLPYKMLFRDQISGLWLQAPGVLRVQKKLDSPIKCGNATFVDPKTRLPVSLVRGYEWVSEALEMKQEADIDLSVLLTEQLNVITEGRFPCSVRMMPGDKLTVMQSVITNVPGTPFEQVIAESMKAQHAKGCSSEYLSSDGCMANRGVRMHVAQRRDARSLDHRSGG